MIERSLRNTFKGQVEQRLMKKLKMVNATGKEQRTVACHSSQGKREAF